MTTQINTFTRDRITVLSYASLSAYAYCGYGLGPLLVLLRNDLNLSYVLMSLHSAVFAAAALTPGAFFSALCKKIGRPRLFWVSAIGTAASVIMLMVATTVVFTITASAVLGATGSFLQASTLAVLADRHGDQRGGALIEANVGASAAAVIAPLVFGFLGESGLTWRIGLLVPMLVLVIIYALYHGEPFPVVSADLSPNCDDLASKLPRRCWLLCVLTGVVVGAEFCVVFYGGPALVATRGISTNKAALAISIFYIGELLGRLIGSNLIRRTNRDAMLLFCSLIITLTTFLVFWLATSDTVALSALFLIGVGMANLYPVALALAVDAAPDRANVVASRTQLIVAFAVMMAPITLGFLADKIGIFLAFTIEVILIVLAVFLLASARPSPNTRKPS